MGAALLARLALLAALWLGACSGDDGSSGEALTRSAVEAAYDEVRDAEPSACPFVSTSVAERALGDVVDDASLGPADVSTDEDTAGPGTIAVVCRWPIEGDPPGSELSVRVATGAADELDAAVERVRSEFEDDSTPLVEDGDDMVAAPGFAVVREDEDVLLLIGVARDPFGEDDELAPAPEDTIGLARRLQDEVRASGG